MADIEYTGEFHAQADESVPRARGIGRTFNIIGALASLALVAGIGVWGYKLVMRDVSGVPVVRSLEGPMREQPDDPGGRQADHQGLSVNTVAAQGTAADPADRLVLAPRPVELEREDEPMGRMSPAPAVLRHEDSPQARTASDAAVMAALVRNVNQDREAGAGGATVTPAAVAVTRPANGAQPEPEKAADADDASGAVTDDTNGAAADDAAVAAAQPAVVTGPGLARSLRPVPRPARAVAAGNAAQSAGTADDPVMASAITAAVGTVAGLEVNPDDLPPGTRLAQLGAYESAEIARGEWDRLAARFEDFMIGKQRVVQKAESGGRTFWRLRAMGFEDLSDARRFCSALMAENADCIAVTVR